MPNAPYGSLAPDGSLVGPLGPALLGVSPQPLWPEGVGIVPYGSLMPFGAFSVAFGPRTFRAAVQDLLASVPNLAATVGGRISYAGSRPSDPEPRVTHLVASHSGDRDLDGPDGIRTARVRVSVWTRDSVQAEVLSDSIRSAIDGWSGWLGSIHMIACDWSGEYDQPELLPDGGLTTVFQLVSDYLIDYQDSGG